MLKKSRICALACAASFALSACAGTSTTPPPGPPLTTLSIATQRNAAQAALAAEFGVGILTLIFGQGTTQAFGGSNTLPVCNNGVKVSVVSGPTTITTTIDVFYDPVCTTILAHTVLVQTFGSSFVGSGAGGSSGGVSSTLAGTATFTSRAGAIIAYNTLSGSVTKLVPSGTVSFSVTGSAAPSPSAPAIASFGLTCSATGASNTCGFGGIQNVSLLNTEFGNTFSFNGTQNGNMNAGGAALKAYLSPLDAMTLSPSGTAWTITGAGSPVINDSGTFTVTVGAFNLASAIGVSLSDATADASATANMSGGPFGNTSGAVTQISNGASATFYGADGAGFGTVLYSDGTTAPVAGFIIQ